MNKASRTYTHLSLSDRIYIEQALNRGMTFKDTAIFLQKDPTTISKEVRRGRYCKENERKTALCTLRDTCTKTNVCRQSFCYNKLCGKCTQRFCHSHCEEYTPEACLDLNRAPYVCNGCWTKSCRQSTKYYYRAQYAHQLYTDMLSTSRRGINKTPLELDDLDRLVTPLLKNGQSLNHIYATHEDEINCSRRTLYSYIEQGALTVGNMDLPRKVRYKPRKVKKKPTENHQAYRNNRTYKDFQRYLEEHPEASVVEMDTVLSSRDSPRAMLTMMFRSCSLMLAFLLEHNSQNEVGKVFETLEQLLGADNMSEVFQVTLTDNGSEFKNPAQIEFSLNGKRRTRVFYCDPMASWQKGRLEKNHAYIRYILPKGNSFAKLSDHHVTLMINHINSTARASLNGATPFELASLLLPHKLLSGLGLHEIKHDQVILKPRLLKNAKPR